MDKQCSWSSFENKFNESTAEEFDPISVKCPGGYIGDLIEFGFLYKFDQAYGGNTVAKKRCEFVMDPFMKFKIPPPPPLCDPDADEEK